MFVRALVAFLVLPFMAGGVVPVVLGLVDPWRRAGYVPGGILLTAIGVVVLFLCVRDFHVIGRGTLAPWAPPKNLVVVGLYRFTRNPMYIGVLLIVSGMALLFGSPLVAIHAVALAIGFHLRVVLNEERWLAQQFGEDWNRYRAAVSRWMPRLTPYSTTPP